MKKCILGRIYNNGIGSIFDNFRFTHPVDNFCLIEGIRMYYTADDERGTVSWLGCDRTQASE